MHVMKPVSDDLRQEKEKKIMRYHFNLLAVIIYGSYHSHVTTFTYWTLPYMEVTTHAMRYHLYLCDVTM